LIERLTIYGSYSIGVFFLSTDKYVLAPHDTPKKTITLLEDILNVNVITTTVGGSVLIGVLASGNSNGLLLPYYSSDDELKYLRSQLHINVVRLPSKRTALGNIILTNDNAAIVNPNLEVNAKKVISDTLNVDVIPSLIAGFKVVGAVGVATNKGCLIHPLASEEELKNISNILKVKVDVGTVNAGFPILGVGLVANSNGALVGGLTTGPELAHIEYSLGLVGD